MRVSVFAANDASYQCELVHVGMVSWGIDRTFARERGYRLALDLGDSKTTAFFGRYIEAAPGHSARKADTWRSWPGMM
jgi:hypothetical protein